MIKAPKGLPWNWTPAGLRPEIARLVARPLLVVPFLNFGGRPLETARRRATVVNGTGNWVDSPVGSGMNFPNPSVGSPTDFLSFASAYPSTSATMVPHSMAVLWSPTVSANTHFPFMTASNGNGVWLQASSSGFGVVHGAVIGFSAIGSTLYAVNNIYLQLYSYDQVTMNHMIVNVTTNKSASQSVAETGALSASNGPRVGVKGVSEALEGTVFGVAWVRGAWTINEMEILARNPTGLWAPAPAPPSSRRRISFVSTAGGATVNPGAGQSQSAATAAGSGASTASSAPASIATSIAFAVGVALAAGDGSSTAPSSSSAGAAAVATGTGASTSASIAAGSNNNVAQGDGVSKSVALALAAAAPTAAGDGRAVAPAVARASGASIAGGTGVAFAIAAAIGSGASRQDAAGISRSTSIVVATNGMVTVILGPRPFTLSARALHTALAARSTHTGLDLR